MPRKGAPKSFAPGTVLYIPYFGRIHEIIVQDCQTGMHWGYVNVLFKDPPEGRFVNPRGVRRNACYTKPRFALEAAVHSYKQEIAYEEKRIKHHQKILESLKESRDKLLEKYQKEFLGSDTQAKGHNK